VSPREERKYRYNKHWDRSNHGASRGKAITIYFPIPLAYDRARIENTILDVGAIGPAAEEIEILL